MRRAQGIRAHESTETRVTATLGHRAIRGANHQSPPPQPCHSTWNSFTQTSPPIIPNAVAAGTQVQLQTTDACTQTSPKCQRVGNSPQSPVDAYTPVEPPPPTRTIATSPVPPVALPWEEQEYSLPAYIWLNTLEKAVARHIKLPRSALQGAPGSQHPTFTIFNSPLELVRLKCEAAGLQQEGDTTTRGQRKVTVFKGMGPMTAFNFCRVERMKALGHGSGALVAPRRSTGRLSEVMTLACPPITVKHIETKHEWKMEVDFYLGVYNDMDRFTLPQPANTNHHLRRGPAGGGGDTSTSGTICAGGDDDSRLSDQRALPAAASRGVQERRQRVRGERVGNERSGGAGCGSDCIAEASGEPMAEAGEPMAEAACYPVGISMWRQGIRVVCIDAALACERAELQVANAAAAKELAAVEERKLVAERERREAVQELRKAKEQRRDVVLAGVQRKGSRRGDAQVTSVQVTAALREESLQEELKLLRRQRSSALALVDTRVQEMRAELASAKEKAASDLDNAVASTAREREKLERELGKRKSSENLAKELRGSLRQVQGEREELASEHAKIKSSLQTARINSAKLEKKASESAASVMSLQRTLAIRARWNAQRAAPSDATATQDSPVSRMRNLENVAPHLLSPASKKARFLEVHNRCRREKRDRDALSSIVAGKERDPEVLAASIAAEEGLLEKVFDTGYVWELRVAESKKLVEKINADWNARLTVELKQLHLISDRDLDKMRHKFSHDVVEGNVRHRLLMQNPKRPWDYPGTGLKRFTFPSQFVRAGSGRKFSGRRQLSRGSSPSTTMRIARVAISTRYSRRRLPVMPTCLTTRRPSGRIVPSMSASASMVLTISCT